MKSACRLFGDCEVKCATGDGGVKCDEDCELAYGSAAAADWIASDSCLYDPAPGGCACP